MEFEKVGLMVEFGVVLMEFRSVEVEVEVEC